MARRRRVEIADTPEYSEDVLKQAWAAAKEMRRLIPMLRAFARSLTGNPKMEIYLTEAEVRSTRDAIWLKPPLGLGRERTHDRAACGMRGPDRLQICPACRAFEVLEFYFYHEIAHCAFGTHVKASARDKTLLEKYLSVWHPGYACNHTPDILGKVNDAQFVMEVAHLFNKWMPLIFNSLEDARVNEAMFLARPGLRTVFDLNIARIMELGIEGALGEISMWQDAPLDIQFLIGLLIVASGAPYVDELDPVVQEKLRDDKLVDLLMSVIDARTSHDVLGISYRVFLRAQELDMLLVQKCVKIEPKPETQPESEPEPDAESGDGPDIPSLNKDPKPNKGEKDGESDGKPGSSADEAGSSSDDASGSGKSGMVPGAGEDGLAGDDESNDGTSDESEPDDSSRSDEEVDDQDSEKYGDAVLDDKLDPEVGDTDSDSNDTGTPESDVDEDDRGENGRTDSTEPGEDDAELSDGGSADDGEATGSDEEGSDGETSTSDDDEADRSSERDDDDSDSDESYDIESDGESESQRLGGRNKTADEVADDAPSYLARFLIHGIEGVEGSLLDVMADGDFEAILEMSPDEAAQLDEDLKTLIAIAILQSGVMDQMSRNVNGTVEVPWPCPGIAWNSDIDPQDFHVGESLLGRILMHARRVFDDNKRAKMNRNLTSGKINTRVLGRRAAIGDPRLFGKKVIPKKRDYFVVIGADCSGSTRGYGANDINAQIKRAVMAQAEMLTRLGINWAGYAHTAYHCLPSELEGTSRFGGSSGMYTYILPFKTPSGRWDGEARTRLANVRAVSGNLDGHTLEYYRKIAEASTATDKIIIYYTDGAMPATNYDEELEVLQRELAYCKRAGITVIGVGIGTDSPTDHGLDTVRIDGDGDLHLVVEHLEKYLLGAK